VAEDLNKAQRRCHRVQLTAPVEAVVLEVAERSVGSVLREAKSLLTPVPLDVPLEAEVDIDTRDMGRIAPGDRVGIKLYAFPFQKHGTATGVVRTISGDTFSRKPEQGGGPTYRARVKIADVYLGNITVFPVCFHVTPWHQR